MEFGLDKCAKASFMRGKKVSAEGIPLNHNHIQVPGNGGGRRGPTLQNEGQDQERV